MTAAPGDPAWADRAAERSPTVQRSRERSIAQAKVIVDAAIELIAEKGSAFTIQELAKRAHVALQTFYRHFAGKDDLLLAVIEQTISQNMAQYQAGAAHLVDPLDRLRFYVTSAFAGLDDPDLMEARRFITAEHFRIHQIFPDELGRANRAFTELLIPEVQAATDAGQLRSDDVASDAWYVTELVMATFHHYAFSTSTESVDEIADTVWRFCLRALGGSPAPTESAPPVTGTGR
jgi:TetR/AcrR family transcriptional regulator